MTQDGSQRGGNGTSRWDRMASSPGWGQAASSLSPAGALLGRAHLLPPPALGRSSRPGLSPRVKRPASSPRGFSIDFGSCTHRQAVCKWSGSESIGAEELGVSSQAPPGSGLATRGAHTFPGAPGRRSQVCPKKQPPGQWAEPRRRLAAWESGAPLAVLYLRGTLSSGSQSGGPVHGWLTGISGHVSSVKAKCFNVRSKNSF